MRQCESAPVTIAEHALRFSLEDDYAARKARDAGAESGKAKGYRVYRHRTDSQTRGALATNAARAAKAAA